MNLLLLVALAQTVDLDSVRLVQGAKRTPQGIEFSNPLQLAEVGCSRKLDGADAATVGVWVCPKRSGEQSFLFRGIPECGTNGERLFRPNDSWVNFLIGTDQHGFFMGTVHGNGSMPFP